MNGKTVISLQKHPQLRDVSSCRDCQQITKKIMGVVKRFSFCLYGQSDCTDVKHFHFEMTKETFCTMIANHYTAVVEGAGGWPESAPSLQIFFQNAHSTCSLPMFASKDSKQCLHKWLNTQYDMIKLTRLKILIQSSLLKDRADKKWDRSKHVLVELVEESPQLLSASIKM